MSVPRGFAWIWGRRTLPGTWALSRGLRIETERRNQVSMPSILRGESSPTALTVGHDIWLGSGHCLQKASGKRGLGMGMRRRPQEVFIRKAGVGGDPVGRKARVFRGKTFRNN